MRERDEIRALTSTHLTKRTHALQDEGGGLYEEMTSSAAVSPGSRLARTRPITAEITPGEWLLHFMRDGSDEGDSRYTPSAGRIDGAGPLLIDGWSRLWNAPLVSLHTVGRGVCVCVSAANGEGSEVAGRTRHSSLMAVWGPEGYLRWGLLELWQPNWSSKA